VTGRYKNTGEDVTTLPVHLYPSNHYSSSPLKNPNIGTIAPFCRGFGSILCRFSRFLAGLDVACLALGGPGLCGGWFGDADQVIGDKIEKEIARNAGNASMPITRT
jgi:hypothetical protein